MTIDNQTLAERRYQCGRGARRTPARPASASMGEIRWAGVIGARILDDRMTAVVSMHRSGRPRAEGADAPRIREQPGPAC